VDTDEGAVVVIENVSDHLGTGHKDLYEVRINAALIAAREDQGSRLLTITTFRWVAVGS